jgi:hypothetical protein
MRIRSTAVLLAAALASVAAPASAQPGAHAHGDETMGVHGMLMFGSDAVFLSHLPLYRAPHDWQMILQARLVGEDGADPMAAYVADRRTSGERVYTLEPQAFAHAVLAESAASPVRFRGTVFRGHFERGGTPILRDVLVEVTRVVVRRRLDAAEADAGEGRFLLFGTNGEAFLAHQVAGAPDFDQVVSIDVPTVNFDPESLARGIPVTIPRHPGDAPLAEGAEVRLRTEDGTEMAARMGDQIYLEFGDLASVP